MALIFSDQLKEFVSKGDTGPLWFYEQSQKEIKSLRLTIRVLSRGEISVLAETTPPRVDEVEFVNLIDTFKAKHETPPTTILVSPWSASALRSMSSETWNDATLTEIAHERVVGYIQPDNIKVICCSDLMGREVILFSPKMKRV